MWSYGFGKAGIGACAIACFFAIDVPSAQDARSSTLPVVQVIATGGTIAGRGASSTSLSNYKAGALLGDELLKAAPEINAARDVTKTSTYRVETFRSPELGFLGCVDSDKVSFYRASTKRHTAQSEFSLSAGMALPKVDIAYTYVETNVAVLQALITSGTKGIVFAGMGAGGLSRADRAVLKSLMSSQAGGGPVLVRSSRVGNGRVIADTANREEYDALGVIPADTLNPQKARILLMLALSKTRDIDQIKRMFSEY